MAQEVMHFLKNSKSRSGNFMVKADLSKAFDRMEWLFICDSLKLFGFPNNFIHLIKACISTTSLAIEVNGKADRYFLPSRGIRHGCPLSPYLFIIGSNVLSLHLENEMRLSRIRGIKIAKAAPPISHLMFADDLLLFGKANEKEAANFNSCQDLYYNWSRQAINFEKSAIQFSSKTSHGQKNIVLNLVKNTKGKQKKSWVWSSIVHVKNWVQQGARWNVGNRRSIAIIEDPWVPQFSLDHIQLPHGVTHTNHLMEARNWKEELVRAIFPEDIALTILNIKVNQAAAAYLAKLIWMYTPTGVFSAKSFYKVRCGADLASSSNQSTMKRLWKIIWHKNNSIPRIRTFIWRCVVDALPVLSVLNKHISTISTTCTICKSENETIEHLLVGCNMARAVWFASSLGYKFDNSPSRMDLWIMELSNSFSTEQLSLAFSIIWAIWKARNSWVFKQVKPYPTKILEEAIRNANQNFGYINQPLFPVSGREDNEVVNPLMGEYICWVDASWKGNCSGDIGIAICEFLNTFCLGKSIFLNHCSDTKMEEAMALLEDLDIGWEILNVIKECRWWIHKLQDIKILFTSRCNNTLAHSLANLAEQRDPCKIWTHPPKGEACLSCKEVNRPFDRLADRERSSDFDCGVICVLCFTVIYLIS
ncbi:uncharacterized protein [Typha angustifolia]|uniref:uncharacterized protein n=1 Tax=Typha angustifolia TaxID=59011 RepID=UPI003C2E428D